MKFNKYNIYVLFMMLLFGISGTAYGQKKEKHKLVGVVLDHNENPLQGVRVSVQEKSTFQLSDKEGKFSLNVDNGDVIVLQKERYKTGVENYTFSRDSIFKMAPQPLYAGERANIAYGTESKRDLISSQSSIHSDEIDRNGVARVDEVMTGNLSGLYAMKSGGTRFGNLNYGFFVRGKATNANASPLILVDDLEADISMVDYRDVESITVLKDALSLGMYGMRGANGVILIKTKRGSNTNSGINFSIKTGIQEAVDVADRINARQYTSLYNESLTNAGLDPIYDPDVYMGERNQYLYPDENFKDKFLKKSAPYQHYLFSANGGNNVAKYYVSAGYLNQQGIFEGANNSSYERFHLRSNVDVNIRQGLTMKAGVFGAIDKNRAPYYNGTWVTKATDDLFSSIIRTPANAYPIFNEDGSLGGSAEYRNNIYGLINRAGRRSDDVKLLNANVSMTQDFSFILPGLSAGAFFGLENYTKNYTSLYSRFAVYEQQPSGDYVKYGEDVTNTLRSSGQIMNSFYRYYAYGANIDYKKSFKGLHNVHAQLLIMQNTQTQQGDMPDTKYQNYALRANYNFMQKYYAEVVASYQGSNSYKRGNRFGLFPSIGLGWILTEEDFLKENEVLKFAKLRATYGVNGNDQTNNGRFAHRQAWTASGGYGFGDPNSGTPGSKEETLNDPGSTWEKAYKFNVGLDVNLWNELDLSVEYFNEKRKDILVSLANVVPDVIGIGLPKYNGGEITNKGVELSLGYTKTMGDWKVLVRGNLLWAKNKVVDLKELAHIYDYMYLKGNSINTRFGYKTAGMYLDEGAVANAPETQFGSAEMGDLIYVNQNGEDDNVIDNNDRVAIGNAFPELIYGATLGVEYKGIDFMTNLQGFGNYDVYHKPGNFTPYAYNNRWSPATPNQGTNFPRITNGSDYNSQTSDFWQTSGRSLTISSVELGYTFPNRLVNKLYMASLRVYANVNNLYTFSNTRDNRNPMAVNAGYSSLPLFRTWSLGLSVKF